MAYRIKQIAALTGLSVRMLRHYDEIGLIAPPRNENGYRTYGEEEILKLQQLLFFRELGFSLKECGEALKDEGFDRKKTFLAQREMLRLEEKRIRRMIETIELTLWEMEKGEKTMADEKKFEALSKKEIEAFHDQYRAEAVENYGAKAVAASEARVKDYDDGKWAAVQMRNQEILTALAALMAGPADDPRVQKLVGEYRATITANYYDCTLEIFAGLAELYVNDGRFTVYFENVRPGLAHYMREAMRYYCENAK